MKSCLSGGFPSINAFTIGLGIVSDPESIREAVMELSDDFMAIQNNGWL
jgi:hypothetical protein